MHMLRVIFDYFHFMYSWYKNHRLHLIIRAKAERLSILDHHRFDFKMNQKVRWNLLFTWAYIIKAVFQQHFFPEETSLEDICLFGGNQFP